MAQPRLVIIEDDEENLRSLKRTLERVGYSVNAFSSSKKALQYIVGGCDLVITDIKMAEIDGIEILKAVKEQDPTIGVILITAYSSVESAVEAMKLGADDYLSKPIDIYELRKRVAGFLDKRNLSRENVELKARLDDKYGFENIIGQSSQMKNLFSQVRLVAPTRVTVLLTGESGTGKDIIANAIHQNSDRKAFSFIPINCAAIPANLMESELFGYERGSFTGADSRRIGKFELAHKGTIFLDEIGELSMDLQAKLLRVIEEKKIMRLGGSQEIPIDVRIIAATNKNLKAIVQDGKFREDLYYRLKVVQLITPPLRDRRDDIPLLVHHFLKTIGKENGRQNLQISKEALDILCTYHWPGNVRQLSNVIEGMVIFSSSSTISANDIPPEICEAVSPRLLQSHADIEEDVPLLPIITLERKAIDRALQYTNGNRTRAARLLGIGLRTLHRKIKEYQLTTEERSIS